MKRNAVRCGCCGFLVLRRELDEYGNGPCCPTRTRLVRSDKGKRKGREEAAGKEKSGAELSAPALLAGQGNLFGEG